MGREPSSVCGRSLGRRLLPVMISPQMTPETKSILLNKEVIAINQDPLARAGDRAYQTGPLEVSTKPLAGGDVAVGLFNRLRSRTEMTLNLSAAGWHGPATARDLWAH
jgi:alpha-galactosidase